MREIRCPNCDKAFKVDESGYAEIVEQVRTKEFEESLSERLQAAEREKESALELTKTKVQGELQTLRADKDAEIKDLKNALEGAKTSQELAIAKAVADAEKDKASIKNQLDQAQLQAELATKSLEEKYLTQIKDRDDAIERLKDMKA